MISKNDFLFSFILKLSVSFFLFTIIQKDAFAAKTGEINLSGKIPPKTSLSIGSAENNSVSSAEVSGFSIASDFMGAFAHDSSVAFDPTVIEDISIGCQNRAVGNVVEDSAEPNGYIVTVSGLNSKDHTGLFVDSKTGASHPFAISYDGKLVIESVITNSDSPTKEPVSKEVAITLPENLQLLAGVYSETLRFTIIAK